MGHDPSCMGASFAVMLGLFGCLITALCFPLRLSEAAQMQKVSVICQKGLDFALWVGEHSGVRFGCLTGAAHQCMIDNKPRVFSGAVWSHRSAALVRLPSQGPAPLSTWGFSLGKCFVMGPIMKWLLTILSWRGVAGSSPAGSATKHSILTVRARQLMGLHGPHPGSSGERKTPFAAD